ncbi:hypothetical protein ACFY78_05750 [Streptomyces olindensis]|uniref:hypothetical protein n=1 Tax=Streptomyces olindensis TaxID=358823 RepID=UPI0036860313
MGIRTLLSRSAPGVGLPPAAPKTSVPAFAATASTVRFPTGLSEALRQATAGFRQHLVHGWRPVGRTGATAGSAGTVGSAGTAGSAGTSGTSGSAGSSGPATTAGSAGPAGSEPTGSTTPRPVTDVPVAPYLTGPTPAALRPGNPAAPGWPGTPTAPGRSPHSWAELARGYLTLVLALLPRPRPAHTTITVFIATTDDLLTERPDGSAPSRRRGRNRRGPEPDATP